MKKILIILVSICFIASCGKVSDASGSATSISGNNPIIVEKTTQSYQAISDTTKQNSPVLGTYTGGFEASVFNEKKDYVYENRITVSIDSISEGILTGHSIVAGNDRPFKGTVKQEGKLFKVEAAEPGDDKYDGKFSFTIDPDQKTVSGTWKANDKGRPQHCLWQSCLNLFNNSVIHSTLPRPIHRPQHLWMRMLQGQIQVGQNIIGFLNCF